MQTRKRQFFEARPAVKPVKIGQKRVTADPLPLGTHDDPVLLLSDSQPAVLQAQGRNQAKRQCQHIVISSDSSSGRSADVHVLLDDEWLRPQQQPAQRDVHAAAVPAVALHLPETDAAPDADVPKKVQVGTSATYNIHQRLGKGGFGFVYLGQKTIRGRATAKPAQVAVKFERMAADQQNVHEWTMYKEIGNSYGLPRFHAKGRIGDWNIMIMELLGKSLWDLHAERPGAFTNRMLACVAIEALTMLHHLHMRGYVHGDVKPENLVLSKSGIGGGPPRLHLVDLGLTVKWRFDGTRAGRRAYSSQLDNFRGTTRYASLHAHLGRTAMPRDDLESLAYSLVFLAKGELPWQGVGGDEDSKRQQVAAKKAATGTKQLCRGLPQPFEAFTQAVVNLRYDEEPEYGKHVAMFQPLLRHGSTPLPVALVDPSLQPAQPVPETSVRPTKVARQGTKGQQYLVVLNSCRQGKQRYHTSMSAQDLHDAVTTGWQEQLYISAATVSPENTWTFVQSENMGYEQQSYKMSPGLLDGDFVAQNWDAGFYITSIAGLRHRLHSLTVMSKGDGMPYTQQSYKICDSFPYDWIVEKWNEGFHVTAAGTSCSSWAIVMSKGAPFLRQVVEVDFAYPSDAIHQRWNAGFRISACASTAVQTAVFMSIPTRKAASDDQETLRNMVWPSDNVAEKWDQGMYISDIAYGRCLH